MEFDTDWRTLGKHRIRLRSAKGFPTEVMHQLPDGQLKLPQFWSRKLPHRVKQDEVEFYSSFVFCARASAASLRR